MEQARQTKNQEPEARGKTLKEAFLKSGLPLQESVGKQFEKLGIKDKGAYSYLRPNAEDAEEVDRWGIKSTALASGLYLTHHVLVECKYYHGKWLFYPATQNVRDLSRNLVIDKFSFPGTSLDTLEFSDFVHAPGMALYDDGTRHWKANHNAIPNALRQAVMGAGPHYCWNVGSHVGVDDERDIAMYHPIVLTTAELFTVRPGTILEDVEGSDDDLTKLLQPARWVETAFSPPPYAAKAYDEMLARELENQIHHLPEVLERERLSFFGKTADQRRASIRSHHLRGVPSRCTFVHHPDLPEYLRKRLEDTDNVAIGRVETAPKTPRARAVHVPQGRSQ